jgi:hypothetical protein
MGWVDFNGCSVAHPLLFISDIVHPSTDIRDGWYYFANMADSFGNHVCIV